MTFKWNWYGKVVGSGKYGSEGNEIEFMVIEKRKLCMKSAWKTSSKLVDSQPILTHIYVLFGYQSI